MTDSERSCGKFVIGPGGATALCAETVGGEYVAYGDVIVRKAEEVSAALRSLMGRQKGKYLWSHDYFWPHGVVPFEFDSNLPVQIKNEFMDARRELEIHTGVSFIPKSSESDDFVYVMMHPESIYGGDSLVGRHGGKQVLRLGVRAPKHSVFHEMGHTLSFYHEHQRPDRNNHINVFYNNILKENHEQFDVIRNITAYGSYDLRSIMHYGPYHFAINAVKPTMTDKSGNTNTVGGPYLSKQDIREIQNVYRNLITANDFKLSTNFSAPTLFYVGPENYLFMKRLTLLSLPTDPWENRLSLKGWAKQVVPLEYGSYTMLFYIGTNDAIYFTNVSTRVHKIPTEEFVGGYARELKPIWNQGAVEIYYIGTNGHIYLNRRTGASIWSGETLLVPGNYSNLEVALNHDGRVELFFTDRGEIKHMWQDNSGHWSPVVSMGLGVGDKIRVMANKDGRLELFILTTIQAGHQMLMTSTLRHMWQTTPGGSWSPSETFNIKKIVDFEVAKNRDGRLEVFAITQGNHLVHFWQVEPNSGWSGVQTFGGQALSIETGKHIDGRLILVYKGTNHAIYWREQKLSGGGWGPERAIYVPHHASALLAKPSCGNGIIESTESCDDGNLVSGDGCNMICWLEYCGNGIQEGAEECDDANRWNGDGCAWNCKKEGPFDLQPIEEHLNVDEI